MAIRFGSIKCTVRFDKCTVRLADARWKSCKFMLGIYLMNEICSVSQAHATLGALTTYSHTRRHATLGREFPLLARAAAETGSIATQNRGTLGGNIANASPAADSPPTLLVYDAELELVSARGSRWVPYHGFWTGYKQTALRQDELIRRIRLPMPTREWKHYYRKVGTRRAQAISKVCFAGAARIDASRIMDVRIALGSVAPTVLRAVETEKILQGERLSPALLRAAQETRHAKSSPSATFDPRPAIAAASRKISWPNSSRSSPHSAHPCPLCQLSPNLPTTQT